jgi:hypothetical protein
MGCLISKELLSVVLGVACNDNTEYNDTILFHTKNKIGINIYELAHKCKEWSYSYGIKLSSVKLDERWCCHDLCTNVNFGHFGATEPEAIFRASEWILDNIKNKIKDMK